MHGERAEDPSLRAAVDAAVREVRHRNARVVAAIRVALRALMSIAFLVAAAGSAGSPLRELFLLNVAALAVGVVVLELLRRGWRPQGVALAAAIFDVLAVALAGASFVAGAAAGVALGPGGNLNGLMVLVILLAAVALPARQAAGIAAAGVSAQVALATAAGLEPVFVLASGIVLAAAAVGAMWAGLRVTGLAARLATEAYLGTLERAHAEALARANATIAAQRDEVVAAHREAELLVRMLVHDLKNPLSAVLQYVDLAAIYAGRPDGAARAREHLSHASSEGRRLADMIGDILLLTGLESGARRPARDPLALGDLLAAVEHSWGDRVREAGVAFRVVCEDDLVLHLDHDLVRRMVENLVANALRYCRPDDLIEIAGAREGDGARIAVRNTGAPVEGELRARLFHNGVSAGAREWHNVGLGLSLCRLVAEAHGGELTLIERPGWSVSFEATLAGVATAAERPGVARHASAR